MPHHSVSPSNETGWKSSPPSRRSPGWQFLGKVGPLPGAVPGGDALPRAAHRPGRLAPAAPECLKKMNAGRGKNKKEITTTTKKIPTPKPESCPGGLVSSDPWRRAGLGPLRAPVPRGRGGKRPRGSGAAPPPNRIGFGEGKPAEERSRPAGEDETWSLPAAPALCRPSRLSLPSCLWGFAVFRAVSRPRRSERSAAGLGPRTCRYRSSRDGDPRLPRHGGGLGPRLRPASRETASELRGTRYRIAEDGRLLGTSPPVFTADLGARGRCSPSLSVGHPRHQVLPTPR